MQCWFWDLLFWRQPRSPIKLAKQTVGELKESFCLSCTLLLFPLFSYFGVTNIPWFTLPCFLGDTELSFFLFLPFTLCLEDAMTPAHCSCWGEEQGILGKNHKLAGVPGTASELLMYNGRKLWDGISPTTSAMSQNLALCRFKLRFNVLLLFLLERYGRNKPIFHNATFVFFPLCFHF